MKTNFLFFALLICCSANAQSGHIYLPGLANKELKFWVQRGAKTDTIQKLTLDKAGEGKLNFSQITKEEMVSFDLPNGEEVRFVKLPEENVAISCLDKECTLNKIIIDNSPTNRKIIDWLDELRILKKKKVFLENLSLLYAEKDSFKLNLVEEINKVKKEMQLFNELLSIDSSFAAKYILLKQISDEMANSSMKSDINRTKARNHFIFDIDFDILYRTGLWFDIINNTIGVYFANSSYHGKFGDDVIVNLKKTRSQEAFDALAGDALYICNKVSWETDKEKIENFLISSNRVKSAKLDRLRQLQKLHVGKKAPDLIIGDGNRKSIATDLNSSKYILLLFHESGCGHCETEIGKIIKDYNLLVSNSVRVISFSSDSSEAAYKEASQSFLWEDHYCSYKGMEDQNFKNYCINGTPSMYLIDNKGIIISKSHTYEQIASFCQKNAEMKL